MVHRIYISFLRLWDYLIYVKMERWFTSFQGHGHQERILNIADKIIYIKDGMVEKYGPKDEVLPSLMHTSKAGCDVLMNKMED